jgi:PASTA domain
MFDVAPWPDLEPVDVDCPPFPETFPGAGLCPETPPTFPEDTLGDQALSNETAADVSEGGFLMPDVVGMNLQEAQDLIQSVSGDILFFTSSVDATGDDRMQLVDSNWYVCAQNVPADTTVSNDADITFAVVKTDEVCP